MTAAQRQEFCVRWNSHLGSIGSAFPLLLAGQRFVDVTLVAEGQQLHCHRLLLAACSSYFENILAENPCKHPVIILPSEIKLWEIQALVDFMYKGEVNVTQAGLPQLLRCAEQLRIRGLQSEGVDSAISANQLKALSQAATASAAAAAAIAAGTQGVGGSGGGGGGIPDSNTYNMEMDDTATNSTTTTTATTTTAASVRQLQQQNAATLPEQIVKKELNEQKQQKQQLQQQQQQQKQFQQQQQQQQQANGGHNLLQLQQLQQQQQLQQKQLQLQQQQLQKQKFKQEIYPLAAASLAASTNSNACTEDDSADDDNSIAYEQYENLPPNLAAVAAAVGAVPTKLPPHLDSTIEDDHNYVAAHDDDSYGATGPDTEHETSANASMLAQGADDGGSFKRVRRSEASLAQAAKCVTRGETFQTVSNMFNIPVSTIRFYMARKGILPKRKRGRGAANSGGGGSLSNAMMSAAIAQMKRSNSPTLDMSAYHQQLMNNAAGGFQLNEQRNVV